MKNKILVLALATSFLVSPLLVTGSVAYATENTTLEASDKVIVTKNDQYIKFEKEFSQLQNQRSTEFKTRVYSQSTQKAAVNLIEKYDGAEITVVRAAAKYSTKFVNGGVNSFATNKSGLQQLRTDLATTATLLLANGTVGGAAVAGPLGALLGLVGGGILGSTVRSASNTIQSWINVGSSKGGVRVTLVEQFPISSLNSQSQAKIKKL
ncbi:hypothetical protein IR166_28785 [Enterococcus faecalis]|nr:hypothetical protein [Enterococcus gallinarum]MBF0799112.1 hypothetical protein [Enterococcus gallinarum]MBF0825586.1 hypothetical protein [Enterococcus faecalis]MBX8991777.1 hypothetical protein [Escherichia coli]TFV13898.1 hypothetical protein E4T76_16720 [Enterococcus gallinarum]